MARPCAKTLLGLAALLLFGAASAQATAPADERGFRAHVAALVSEGELTFEEGLVVRFQRVFDPAGLPPALRGAAVPNRSATLLIHEYKRLQGTLSPAAVDQIDSYLTPRTAAFRYGTVHFDLAYDTQGADAVPADDFAPANGVPDFVERVGEYLETSWTVLFDQTGFRAPGVPAGGYPVSFRGMGAYGYTEEQDGATHIVLHRSFQGFPANSDPDGAVLGAAKVTAAHELKHASQFASSGWTEQGWLEADATWAEDFVFDETDDYLRFLTAGSPVSAPESWLPNGAASYEDCLWQRSLSEAHGPLVLVDFFSRRAAVPGETVTAAFDAVLRQRGSSLAEAALRLGVWSHFCGANARLRPIGFEEAESYPTPPVGAFLDHDSAALSRTVSTLGTTFILVDTNEREGQPWVQFLGNRSLPFAVSAVATDVNGVRRILSIDLDPDRVSSSEVPVNWNDLSFLTLVVTSLNGSVPSSGYYLSVDDQAPTGVEPTHTVGFQLLPNRPNPFRGATTIGFSLAADGPVRLAVYDVRGRMVRRLVQGEVLTAGPHERVWNGVDEAGRPAAPGVYYVRLDAAQSGATNKMLLLR
ncbi:MAG TPA: MXAN_6640 family putative metalloprotease [bacterium]|nr:MXAN_6640 family putative metalloprotease [bacterium]